MISQSRVLFYCSLLLIPSAAFAEDAPQFPGTAPEHELLKRFVGAWTSTSECTIAPGADPMKSSGKMVSRMLGERWVVSEMTVGEGVAAVEGILTIGYDPAEQKYVGTWTDNMQNRLWVYEGSYDEEKRTLMLDTTGPNITGEGEIIPYQDSYEFVSDDEIVMRSKAKGEDGEWVTFMTSQMRRASE